MTHEFRSSTAGVQLEKLSGRGPQGVKDSRFDFDFDFQKLRKSGQTQKSEEEEEET
jgi:hypothetical protein